MIELMMLKELDMHRPMQDGKYPPSSCRMTEQTYQLYGGRIACFLALLAFGGAYMWGIGHYGLVLGMGLGWLPCAALAWAVAQTAEPIANKGLRYACTGCWLVVATSMIRRLFP